jgi:hypothetical protein
LSKDGLEALRGCVFADPELVRRLHGLAGEPFSDEIVRVAAELRCDVAAADVRTAIAQAREAWMLRWIL